MRHLLEVSELTKLFTYPKTLPVIKNISLSLDCGETLAIMGASGEGKSTLLHILGALDQASSGTLAFQGKPYDSHSSYELKNAHFGFVFQSFYLFEDDSAIENVLLPARIMRKPVKKGSQAYGNAIELISSVGLDKHRHTPVKLLSGGERQRIAIARAFCNNPEIIFADEPTGNLDHQTSDEIHSLLLSHVRNYNKSLVVVTHDSELASMCDRTYHLANGSLKQ